MKLTSMTLLTAGSLLLAVGCSNGMAEPLTINDAVSAGFEKGAQQMYQMVQAQDGWGGTWQKETVELYQYGSKGDMPVESFEAAVQEGNMSGWVEMCQHKNMLMLSKGKEACAILKGL